MSNKNMKNQKINQNEGGNMKEQQIIRIVERNLDEELDAHIKAGDKLPLVLVGGTGLGKTSRVLQAAERCNSSAYVIHLAQAEDVGDVLGFTIKVNDKIEWRSLPMWEEILERQNRGEKSVIFLDEYNRAKPALTHSVFQLLAEWRVKDMQFDPRYVRIIEAINPSGEYAVREDDLAWKARVCYYIVKEDHSSWISYMEKKGLLNSSLKKFFIENKNLISPNVDFDEDLYQGIPTPRTWERVFIAEKERNGISLKMLIGLIGRTAALALINFKPKLPSFKEIVERPELLEEVDKGDRITLLESGIEEKVGVKEGEFMAVFRYLKDKDRELIMAWLSSIWKRAPDWKCTHKEFEEWVAQILGIPVEDLPRLKKLLEELK
jgi:hypothetical protein